MTESKIERRIKDRYDQTITEEQLATFEVPLQCRDCPLLRYEYCEQRNKAKDYTFRHVAPEHNELLSGLANYQSPTSNIGTKSLQKLLINYMIKVERYRDEHLFAEEFTEFLSANGMPECEGVIEFDETQPYARRFTRDKSGLPVLGDAKAVCRQNPFYVRDQKGFADLALQAVEINSTGE